jgi:hypothetical protein
VIEVEQHRVGFSAVDARMLEQVLVKPSPGVPSDPSGPLVYLPVVQLPVLTVISLAAGCIAHPAIRLPTIGGPLTAVETVEG